tara:strand:- start:903 stop:1016 length:114 start_codon:yes stop_codon:yes gene_type:complete
MDKITVEDEQYQDDERGLLLLELKNKINEIIDWINSQ